LQGIPSNVIIRSLGPEPLVQVDIEGPHTTRPGDIYLLCSDGLSGQLRDGEIGAIARMLPPADACRLLVDLANLGGGPDNITVLIVRLRDERDETAAEPAPKEAGLPWYRRLPWPYTTLVLGVVLAAAAGVLTYYQISFINMAVFVLAALAISAGLIGLVLFYNEEKRRLVTEEVYSPPHIYRQATCQLDRPLVEKMAKAALNLKQQLQEKQWDADWAAQQHYQQEAESHLSRENLEDSFRAYARSVRLLLEALQRQRPRGEVFHPVWH
jgi:protein phosphatase